MAALEHLLAPTLPAHNSGCILLALTAAAALHLQASAVQSPVLSPAKYAWKISLDKAHQSSECWYGIHLELSSGVWVWVGKDCTQLAI